ncbi:MAG: thioredoxin fold domain-containing protein [Comamonadaceae bacterium]|nr:thioredoxin fold domain-containing protein [Comamonadaceae bacterium]
MVYFGQDGCPYCKELMQTNFSQRAIVDKTRRHFMPIALNIWGDREVTWIDGKRMAEKDFAKMLKVQFTPTLLFLDEKGEVVVRLNGYYPPHRFEARARLCGGRHGEEAAVRRVHEDRGARAGERQAERADVLHEAALRPAPPGRRQAARRAVRNPLLRALRRDAQGGLPSARRCRRCCPASTWRASRCRTAPNSPRRAAVRRRAKPGRAN